MKIKCLALMDDGREATNFVEPQYRYQLQIFRVDVKEQLCEVLKKTEWIERRKGTTHNISYAGITFSYNEDLNEVFIATNTIEI